MTTQERETCLSDVFGAVYHGDASLVGESAGYIVLGALDQVRRSPCDCRLETVFLSKEGQVEVRGTSQDAHLVEQQLRGLLGLLLRQVRTTCPNLQRVVQRGTLTGLDHLNTELEAALVPVNRRAAARSLARLVREASRAAMNHGAALRVEDVPPLQDAVGASSLRPDAALAEDAGVLGNSEPSTHRASERGLAQEPDVPDVPSSARQLPRFEEVSLFSTPPPRVAARPAAPQPVPAEPVMGGLFDPQRLEPEYVEVRAESSQVVSICHQSDSEQAQSPVPLWSATVDRLVAQLGAEEQDEEPTRVFSPVALRGAPPEPPAQGGGIGQRCALVDWDLDEERGEEPRAKRASVESSAEQASVEASAERAAVAPSAEQRSVEVSAERMAVAPSVEHAEAESSAEQASVEASAERMGAEQTGFEPLAAESHQLTDVFATMVEVVEFVELAEPIATTAEQDSTSVDEQAESPDPVQADPWVPPAPKLLAWPPPPAPLDPKAALITVTARSPSRRPSDVPTLLRGVPVTRSSSRELYEGLRVLERIC